MEANLACYNSACIVSWGDMSLLSIESTSSADSPKAFPQLVSHASCFRCDVCCRFPEADSFLRPYFTAQEISGATAAGVSPEFFPSLSGSQIDVVRDATGEGYLCPAFDPSSSRCGIYETRPLDCRLYPLALMWDAAHQEVVLGWDTKCPVMSDTVPATIASYAERVTELLAGQEVIDAIVANPRLIGRFQDDVVVVKSLPQLTARLVPLHAPAGLCRLTLADASRFARALGQWRVLGPDTLAAYAFPYHYSWTTSLPYWWMECRGTLFVFAHSPDGWFMPLPPLGPRPLAETAGEAFGMMREWNGFSPVSRIENVTVSDKAALERIGFRSRPKEGDYLYSAERLALLAGNRYKSQRALCNRVEREQAITGESYHERHRDGCFVLQNRWSQQKEAGGLDATASLLLQDAAAAHALVFDDHERMGLSGTVAIIRGRVVAYTFGYWLTPRTWCVFLEVADRSVPGLAQWLFRDTCRRAVAHGADSINAMDDAGLPGLRAAKRAYHPASIIENYVIVEAPL